MKNLKKILILGVVLLIFIFLWISFIGMNTNQSGGFFNKGHNAIWIGHKWVGEDMNENEISKLVDRLESAQIDTVFVHTGPFEEDGTVDPSIYEYAVDFLETAKGFAPDIQYQAWVGQLRHKIDLEDSHVRHNVAKQALIFTEFTGFDGIHFDIEPVWDQDLDFIETLKETRDLLPEDKKISVALAEFIPKWVIKIAEKFHGFKNYNTEVNYEAVSKYADQIIAMNYDTDIENEWTYKWLVKEETIWVTNLLEDTEVFIGLPAYEDEKEGFNPLIENIGNGLMGVIAGLNNIRSNEDSFAGIAIYSYWEMDEEEWGIYDKIWLK